MKVTASAPGKLVLLGEYAVLAGAPAVVMAVNRRAVVELEPTADTDYRVCAPGWRDSVSRFRLAAGEEPHWGDAEGARAFSLVPAVLASVVAAGLPLTGTPPWSATLDTRNFFRGDGKDDRKLGLGSSAALTVALASAVAAWTGYRAGSDWLPTLLRAHREFQGGRGSGLDVAAALNGGVIEYRIGPAPNVHRLQLPERVKMRCVWTRCEAHTGAYLDGMERWRQSQPAAYANHMEEMGAVSAAGVAALRTADDNRFLDAVNDYADRLAALGQQASTDIFSKPHMEIAHLAAASGVVYKPCGAGGGDVGIAFALDEDRLERFEHGLKAKSYPTLDLSAEPIGAQATTKETSNANAGI